MRSATRSQRRSLTSDRLGRRRHQRFTARVRRDSGLASQYAKHLAGELIAIAPYTMAEARYGALKSGWGPRRIAAAAVRWSNPLVAHDGVFISCPVLELRSELTG